MTSLEALVAVSSTTSPERRDTKMERRESMNTNADNKDKKKGGKKKLKVGVYKLSNEKKVCKFVYVPAAYIRNPAFTFEEVFTALGIAVPQLIFEVSKQRTRFIMFYFPCGIYDRLQTPVIYWIGI